MPHYDRHSADSFIPDSPAQSDARDSDLNHAAAALREPEVEAAEGQTAAENRDDNTDAETSADLDTMSIEER